MQKLLKVKFSSELRFMNSGSMQVEKNLNSRVKGQHPFLTISTDAKGVKSRYSDCSI